MAQSSALFDADIIFHTSRSRQSEAIQRATNSRYSHVGILFNEGAQWYVYEAGSPVKKTPLQQWINRGVGKHYVIRRLKNRESLLRPSAIQAMKSVAREFIGTPYDIYFGWSDDRLYCSELVWKVYKRGAGVELNKPTPMSEFNLTDPVVAAEVKRRFPRGIPRSEKAISPDQIFRCQELITVAQQ
jgi:cell wall-associated NlpC family hydrolase